MEAFDVLFVMALCFATLLTTMLIQGGVLVGGNGTACINYHFDGISAALVGVACALYLGCILPRSDQELRSMIARHYGEKKEEGDR